jgi:hypothetical protein
VEVVLVDAVEIDHDFSAAFDGEYVAAFDHLPELCQPACRIPGGLAGVSQR